MILIELPDEAGKVRMLEMPRQNALGKLIILHADMNQQLRGIVEESRKTYIQYNKTVAHVTPSYNMLVRGILEHPITVNGLLEISVAMTYLNNFFTY